MRLCARIWAASIICCLPASGWAQSYYEDFGKGDTPPAGWVLSEGTGRYEMEGPRVGSHSVSVTGTGLNSNYWRHDAPGLQPNATYRISFRAKRADTASGGSMISGLDRVNRDFAATPTWDIYSFVFATPSNMDGVFLRLGQWMMGGKVSFADLQLTPVAPVNAVVNGRELGAGENITDGRYEFSTDLGGSSANASRCLVSATAAFNSNRWVVTGGTEVMYRHAVTGARLTDASISLSISHYVAGECVVEVSGGGATWQEVGRFHGVGSYHADAPASLFPAGTLCVRFRGASATNAAGDSLPGAFQVDHYEVKAGLDRKLPDSQGATQYLELKAVDSSTHIQIRNMGTFGQRNDDAVALVVTPTGRVSGEVVASLSLRGEKGVLRTFTTAARLKRGATPLLLPYRWNSTGTVDVSLSVLLVTPGKSRRVFAGTTQAYVPRYFASDYGRPLPAFGSSSLWWCDGTYKINPKRPAPVSPFPSASSKPVKLAPGAGIRMSVARREREHAQLVLRPAVVLGPVSITVTDLRGPGAARIPSSAVTLRDVTYVRVRIPTDSTSSLGEWPDPLAPLSNQWRPRAGRNNPLWITVECPANARPGTYDGSIVMRCGSLRQEVPLQVHVRTFALPAHTALRSGFGIDPSSIRRFHNLRTPEALVEVWDKYMHEFAKRRVNPYNPMALAPYHVQLEGVTWQGGQRDEQQPHQGRWCLRINDDSTTSVAEATTHDLIPVKPGSTYRLSWWVRTHMPAQAYQVTVGSFNADRTWLTGRNIDITHTGNGAWQNETVDITSQIPEQARFVTITVRPAIWTEKGEATGVAWFDDVSLTEDGGPNLVPDPGFEADQSLHLRFDWADFDKAAHRYLDGLGFNAFTINFEGLGGGRYPNYDHGSIQGYRSGTPEYEALMEQFGREIQDHLEKNGWLDKAYVYWYDEPEENDYPFVCEGMAKLRKYAPKLKRMLTEQFEKPLFGNVDLWCPLTPAYSAKPAHERQKLGEEVWWYVCTGPKAPYCTLFIDHPATEMRLWLWQTWKNRVQGLLIWATTWWSSPAKNPGETVQNPWDDPMSYADSAGMWGNGDGRFYYPPNRHPNEDRTTEFRVGPVISMRWEMLSKGIEDWEYFRLLDALVERCRRQGIGGPKVERAARLLTVPSSVTRDMTTFAQEPHAMLAHRQAVGDAIEALTRLIK